MYITKVPKDVDREEWIKLLSLVDNKKRQKILGYKKTEDRLRSLIADVMVRYFAIKELGIKNDEIVYEYNGRGKPFIKGAKKFFFSVSHSGEYVAFVIGRDFVGCDIQKKIPCDISIGNVIFTKEEQALVKDSEEFYKMWTLKEALLKAIGIGISEEGLAVNIVKNKKISEVIYDNKKYYFKCFQDTPFGYSLSVWSANKAVDSEIQMVDYNCLYSLFGGIS